MVTHDELEVGMVLVESINKTDGTVLVKENSYISRANSFEQMKAGTPPNMLLEPFKVIRKRD